MIPLPRFDVTIRNYQGKLLLAQDEESLELADVGAYIFRLVDGERSLDAIATIVATEYAIDYESAYSDCQDLIESLITTGMLNSATESSDA